VIPAEASHHSEATQPPLSRGWRRGSRAVVHREQGLSGQPRGAPCQARDCRHRHSARGGADVHLQPAGPGARARGGHRGGEAAEPAVAPQGPGKPGWRARRCGRNPACSFAASMRRDLPAVQAALDLPWTTSPAEGQINRIKTIKRSMYGRAGFQLLRARVLHAA